MSKSAQAVDTAIGAVRGTAAIAAGASMLAASVASTLDMVHRDTSEPMGELCIALVRRRVRSAQLRSWAERLQRGAHDLLALAERMDEAKREQPSGR